MHDDRQHAGADDRDDHDQDDEVGEAHPGIDEALHDHVELAAEIAVTMPMKIEITVASAGGGEADDHREPRAVEEAREDVAAEIVGAEPELPDGGFIRLIGMIWL